MQFDGGLTVTPQMRRLMSQPGTLSGDAGQRFRELYSDGSAAFDISRLSPFGLACCAGVLKEVEKLVEGRTAPPLDGTETPYEFGYATLIVSGAQRITGSDNPDSLKHDRVLEYLISKGMPVDVPDIAGQTALYHCTASPAPLIDLARILIVSGKADVNHRSRYGEVALLGVFQQNRVDVVDLLMEHGADLDVPDGDGLSARQFFVNCGPQITACIRKWVRKREGTEGEVSGESMACICGKKRDLKVCARCKVSKYCSPACQKSDWKRHKRICVAFSSTNSVTIKPFYTTAVGKMFPTAAVTRNALGIPQDPVNPKHMRASHVPDNVDKKDKDMIIKVQVPLAAPTMDLLVYDKKRDFVCSVRRGDGFDAYDKIYAAVRAHGVGGAKAYFAATLKSENELVVKVGDVLAEQPF
ncbi:hypothetical protein CCMSSC00406_0008622 [Pleurotus cornucopiae]|uniref:Uncharacterized protein n=1 Tax=Pleurotus cornucopiae TaxID=5321 RepID=A0ACB7IHP9_PLECO|nr:hypothetical protein CCMSSC00406_0008622 [Pleurotus cornucopiae]